MSIEEKILVSECLELYLHTQEMLNRYTDIKTAWERYKKNKDEENLSQLNYCLNCISDQNINVVNELKNAPLEVLSDYLLREEV